MVFFVAIRFFLRIAIDYPFCSSAKKQRMQEHESVLEQMSRFTETSHLKNYSTERTVWSLFFLCDVNHVIILFFPFLRVVGS